MSNNEIPKWLEEAKSSVHHNGERATTWEKRFIELHKELDRANKIIDRLVGV
jgi:hypothetical protein